MNALKKVAKLPDVRIERWLRLYPTDADTAVRRFKRTCVRYMGLGGSSENLAEEQFLRPAFERVPKFPTTVGHAPAHEFGITNKTPYTEVAAFLWKLQQDGLSIQPCMPWEIGTAAMVLSENRSIYMPENVDIFCFADYSIFDNRFVCVIENEVGFHWLHLFEQKRSQATVNPEDWILFRC